MSDKFKPLKPDLWAPLTKEEQARFDSFKDDMAMQNKFQRFDVYYDGMDASPDGVWVKYDDVQSALESANAEILALKELVSKNNCMPFDAYYKTCEVVNGQLELENKKLTETAYVADILSQKNSVMLEEVGRLTDAVPDWKANFEEVNAINASLNQWLQASNDENAKLAEQLAICDRAIESLSDDRTEAYEIIDKLEAAFNKIGMLAMSETAYTSEFTEQAKAIVQKALK